MAYETKVILIAIANHIKTIKDKDNLDSKASLREVYNFVAEMANAEGIVLKPFDETK